MHSLSHNCPIDMRLEWKLQEISACFACLDKLYSRIWAWCVDEIVAEVGRFKLIEFSDDSLM